MHGYNSKVILGDFNADQLSSTADASFVKSIVSENSLTSIPHKATYHRNNLNTDLDLYLVDSEDLVVDNGKDYKAFNRTTNFSRFYL